MSLQAYSVVSFFYKFIKFFFLVKNSCDVQKIVYYYFIIYFLFTVYYYFSCEVILHCSVCTEKWIS